MHPTHRVTLFRFSIDADTGAVYVDDSRAPDGRVAYEDWAAARAASMLELLA
jgi:hypothetical protein